MANALFVCLHNAGRSQMSQALFERAAEGSHGARSAGTTPGERVHPEVVAVMEELGIDDVADSEPGGRQMVVAGERLEGGQQVAHRFLRLRFLGCLAAEEDLRLE
ncbi:MAG: hypothetical protein H0X42_10485 [Solirubrobacterales bacterium]|nr:hypothetical protein [Solirubrobacterales bacterium]